MKKLRLWQIAVAMTAVITLTSCNSDEYDGDWDDMIWKTEVKATEQDGTYLVAATGGELTFSCKNYQHPWISEALYAGEYYNPDVQDDEYHTINRQKLSLDWFKAEITGNLLKVTFAPNQATTERPIKLNVTAGDIFYSFTFKQSANK
jgi:hypothetical protein